MEEASNNDKFPLDTSKAERSVWLMKCPTVVSRSLQMPNSSNLTRPVAKVILSLDPLSSNDDESSPQEAEKAYYFPCIPSEFTNRFTMELAGTGSENVPKCYSMNMYKDVVPMSVFSESAGGRVSVEGKILHKFDMKPDNSDIENYAKLCRERTKQYVTKTRQIQVIEDNTGRHMRPLPWMDKKKMPGKVPSSDTRRTRRDRGEMEEIMFKLFERQPNWTLRQLIQETDQPEQFLRDLLKDLCIYKNKGVVQGTYELKQEYKKAGDEPQPNT